MDTSGQVFNFCCVWTGNPDSPLSEWFEPWKENVRDTISRGMKLLVIGHTGSGKKNKFQYTNTVGEKAYFQAWVWARV